MDALKGKAINLKDEIAYADGAVISKTLLKKETGNITLFSFDKGQGLSEHTSPFDAVVQVVEGEGAFIIDGERVDGYSSVSLCFPIPIRSRR